MTRSRGEPCRISAAARTSSRSSPSSTAAMVRTVRATGSRCSARAANACSRRVVMGRSSSPSVHVYRSDSTAAANSSRASGLPRPCRSTRSRTVDGSRGARSASSAADAASSMPPSSIHSIAWASANGSDPGRDVHTTITRSPAIRRLTKANASIDGWSIHRTSSTHTRTGCSAAASTSSSKTARNVKNGFTAAESFMPKQARRASRWMAGNRSTRDNKGRSTWWRPANGRCRSDWLPRAVSTVNPSDRACSATPASSALLPIPGSPTNQIARPSELLPSRRPDRDRSSSSRPIRRCPVVMLTGASIHSTAASCPLALETPAWRRTVRCVRARRSRPPGGGGTRQRGRR